MSNVNLRGIRKSFGNNEIVKGIDLAIDDGEFLVMVGPSGCGKSTLLRLIAGLETLDSGEIYLGDKLVNDLPPRDRDVAMVFQSYALYPHMTVRENMAFGLKLRNLSPQDIDARVKEAASLLELEPLLQRKPQALSGGQRQRVAMGRALVRQPQLFLFDEPLSNLDTALRVQMRGELARLHRRFGTTMIYVTHDQVEAMTLATRVAVFNQGTLQQVGKPLALYDLPANRFVAGFLGSPSMNFLSVQRVNHEWVGKGFRLPLPADLGKDTSSVLLGFRPQDLRISGHGPFHGTVDSVERLGFDGYAYVKTDDGLLVARFDKGINVNVGDVVNVSMPSDSVHVFSEDGAQALRHPTPRRTLEAVS